MIYFNDYASASQTYKERTLCTTQIFSSRYSHRPFLSKYFQRDDDVFSFVHNWFTLYCELCVLSCVYYIHILE